MIYVPYFWLIVSAILCVVAVWKIQMKQWVSVLFSAVAALCLIIVIVMLIQTLVRDHP